MTRAMFTVRVRIRVRGLVIFRVGEG
jgi:hypothetical protein